MKTLFTTLFFSLLFTSVFSQDLAFIETIANQTIEVTGNLSKGQTMEDLSWAWNSSVACFPATQQEKFKGKHVLFMADVPKYTELKIILIPDDPTANFSLYAYEVGKVTSNNLVPNLSSCIRCEVDHIWDYKHVGKTQDHTRIVTDILAINNPYQVVIGVVGPKGVEEADFKLQIVRKSR